MKKPNTLIISILSAAAIWGAYHIQQPEQLELIDKAEINDILVASEPLDDGHILSITRDYKEYQNSKVTRQVKDISTNQISVIDTFEENPDIYGFPKLLNVNNTIYQVRNNKIEQFDTKTTKFKIIATPSIIGGAWVFENKYILLEKFNPKLYETELWQFDPSTNAEIRLNIKNKHCPFSILGNQNRLYFVSLNSSKHNRLVFNLKSINKKNPNLVITTAEINNDSSCPKFIPLDSNKNYLYYQTNKLGIINIDKLTYKKLTPPSRVSHTSIVKLRNGDILFSGGYQVNRSIISNLFGCREDHSIIERYDTKKGEFTKHYRFHYPRNSHTVSELPNGNILFIGGQQQYDCDSGAALGGETSTVELLKDKWSF